MAMNPLPPQAYTKDTLLKAYSWLQNQSANIREMANTPDILVSLYLKANRDGDSSLDRPSITNFKKELKNLAGLMGELEAPPAQPVNQSTSAAAVNAAISASLQAQLQAQMQNNVIAPQAAPQAQAQSQAQFVVPNPAPKAGSTSNQNVLDLDQLSREMIREVKNQLNLSSDEEALRAVIRLGHLQISRLFR